MSILERYIVEMTYFRDSDFFPIASQNNGEEIVYETLQEKLELSLRVVNLSCDLLNELMQALNKEQHDENFPKLRRFLKRSNDILHKYCSVHGLIDRVKFVCPEDVTIILQCVILIDEVLWLTQRIKQAVQIYQSVRNAKSLLST